MLYSITANVFNKGSNCRLTNRTALSEQQKKKDWITDFKDFTAEPNQPTSLKWAAFKCASIICLFFVQMSIKVSSAISHWLTNYSRYRSRLIIQPHVNLFLFFIFIKPYSLLMKPIALQVQTIKTDRTLQWVCFFFMFFYIYIILQWVSAKEIA